MTKQLDGLQYLRALAALTVVIHHAGFDAGVLAQKTGQVFSLETIPWMAGVDMFFVISGFIMVYASGSLFEQNGGTLVFLKRRLVRIIPLYWLMISLFLIVMLLTPQALNSEKPGFWQIIASYLFIPHTRNDGLVQPVYSLGWTLNYEMFFYLVFACSLIFSRQKAVAGLSFLFLGLVAIGYIYEPLPQPFGFWTNSIILEFVFGMWIACLWQSSVKIKSMVLYGAAIFAFALLIIDLSNILPRFLAFGVPAAILVTVAAFKSDRSFLPVWLQQTGLLIGNASYALYLVHPFIVRAGRIAFERTGLSGSIALWVYIVICVFASCAAALVLYRWFEKPVMQKLSSPV